MFEGVVAVVFAGGFAVQVAVAALVGVAVSQAVGACLALDAEQGADTELSQSFELAAQDLTGGVRDRRAVRIEGVAEDEGGARAPGGAGRTG